MVLAAGAVVALGCSSKPLASSPCGAVASASEVQPGVLSVSGSFPVNTLNQPANVYQLVLVVTTGPSQTRDYPATSMTPTAALIYLTSLPLIQAGTYPAVWIMDGCRSPRQTQIFGPDSVTISG